MNGKHGGYTKHQNAETAALRLASRLQLARDYATCFTDAVTNSSYCM